MDLHDRLKSYKHGFSKVTDHATREIRHGRLTRDDGLALVRRYEHAPLQHANKFCDWLGVNIRALNFMLDQHRNPRFWKQTDPGVWSFSPIEQGEAPYGDESAFRMSGFIANSQLADADHDKYITVGKGWP
jgi:hypothetical protein